MDFRLSAEEEAFRKEVQDFIRENVPADWPGVDPDTWQEDGVEEVHHFGQEIKKKLAAKGWIGLTWPKKYAGQEQPLIKQMIRDEELIYRGVPGLDPANLLVGGPTILLSGTEEQKEKYIPAICRGEIKFAEGMSEPNAGSDLANLSTKAIEQDDCYLLNGQKIWQSGAHLADYSLAWVRTDLEVPARKGISCIIIPLKSEGVTMRRLTHMSGCPSFNEIFYDNVKIPKENIVGGKNNGWGVLLATLANERTAGKNFIVNARRDLDLMVKFCKETEVNGQPLAKDPLVRNRLAKMSVDLDVGRTLCYRLDWKVLNGEPVMAEGSRLKLYGGQLIKRMADLGIQLLGQYGQLNENSKWVQLKGRMEYLYMASIGMNFAGGTNEITRNTVAKAALGMPKG